MSGYVLSANGELKDAQGNPVKLLEIPDSDVIVPHLKSHVTSYQLPGGDIVKVRIIYTSHCWNCAYASVGSNQQVKFMDGKRPRSFCTERYQLLYSP